MPVSRWTLVSKWTQAPQLLCLLFWLGHNTLTVALHTRNPQLVFLTRVVEACSIVFCLTPLPEEWAELFLVCVNADELILHGERQRSLGGWGEARGSTDSLRCTGAPSSVRKTQVWTHHFFGTSTGIIFVTSINDILRFFYAAEGIPVGPAFWNFIF